MNSLANTYTHFNRNSPYNGDSNDEEYLKWINYHLQNASPPMEVMYLTEENMRNGVAIGLLLETVGNLKLDGLLLQPGTRVERLHNVHEIFSVLRRMNVRLDNVQPDDVMNGDRNAVIQLITAISSYFLLHPRARTTMPQSRDSRFSQYSMTPSPRSSIRRTPSDRYDAPSVASWNSSIANTQPYNVSQMDSEILQGYSHQIIGPNVDPGGISGHSSPRSRSSITLMFSGRHSPGKALSEISDYNTPARRGSPERTPSRNSENQYRFEDKRSIRRVSPRREPTMPDSTHYVDSMNQLSDLKKQLHTISKLPTKYRSNQISSDNAGLSLEAYSHTIHPREVQVDLRLSTHELENELRMAREQVAELTRIIQAKDKLLHQAEQENVRLHEALRTLRESKSGRSSQNAYLPTMNNNGSNNNNDNHSHSPTRSHRSHHTSSSNRSHSLHSPDSGDKSKVSLERQRRQHRRVYQTSELVTQY